MSAEQSRGGASDASRFQETVELNQGADTTPGASAPESVPESFGRYRIIRPLGEGAMGVVYLAMDTQLNREVALKIPKFGEAVDPTQIKRFDREARSAATLNHPNICPVFDVGEINGTHYITMAYIQGRLLSDFVNSKNPPPTRSIAWVIRKAALALHEAHSRGVVHRDLKPANIMINQRNEPIIMDFGLAQLGDHNEDARLTQDGTIMGSPAYMSPEQLGNDPEKLGPASDVYSLGVVLYELLTGRLPFQGSGSVMSMIAEIFSKEPPNPMDVRQDLDDDLAAICQTAMSKQVSDRYGSMQEMAAAINEYLKSGGQTTTVVDAAATNSELQSDPRTIGIDDRRLLDDELLQAATASAALAQLPAAHGASVISRMPKWSYAAIPAAAVAVGILLLALILLSGMFADNSPSDGGAVDGTTEVAASAGRESTTTVDGKSGSREIGRVTAVPSGPPGAPAPPAARVVPRVPSSTVINPSSADDSSAENAQATGLSTAGFPEGNSTGPVGPLDPRLRSRPPVDVDRILNDLDINGDDALDGSEIPPFDRLMFADLDGDDNGSISRAELQRMNDEPQKNRPHRHTVRGAAFARRMMDYDTNEDGRLSPRELPILLRDFIDEADGNRDGFLDASELRTVGGPRGPSRRPPPDGNGPGPPDRPFGELPARPRDRR
jgi:serine/threonine protein kinase